MNTPLRVLVVLPMYGGSLPVGRYCVTALREMGHIPDVFEAPSFHPAFHALKELRVGVDSLEYLENSFLQVVSQAVLAKVQSFEPDLVLSMAQAPLNRHALKRLRSDGVATAMWFVEDFRLFTYWRAFAPHYDFFAVIQKEPFLEELVAIGQENALYLPLAALPSFHKPLDLNAAERRKYGSDVSFVGAGYPNRRAAFRHLVQYDLKIWGSDWDGDLVLAKHVQMGGARVSSEDAVKVFNASPINVNLHSSVRSDPLVPGGDFVNPRTFELAACGAFQLVDERSLLSELFDQNLVTFADMGQLREHIDHYLDEPDARRQMACKARARVLRDHTYARRMDALLQFVGERRAGWPKPRSSRLAVPADYPEDLRKELSVLLETLELSGDVAFPDLVAALRQRQGRLSSLETAVLFLDEWRKQYKKER